MQQNVEDYDKLLDQFEQMFMHIPGDLDFSKLRSIEELKKQEESQLKPEESKEEKRRASAIIKFEVCDQFGFIKQEVTASDEVQDADKSDSD
jgi:hypothetical protein